MILRSDDDGALLIQWDNVQPFGVLGRAQDPSINTPYTNLRHPGDGVEHHKVELNLRQPVRPPTDPGRRSHPLGNAEAERGSDRSHALIVIANLSMTLDATAGAARDLGWSVLRTDHTPNRTISPSSFTLSLGFLSQGAGDSTFENLDAPLGLTVPDRGEVLAELRATLKQYDSLPAGLDPKQPLAEPIVHQATQMVAVSGIQIDPGFTSRVEPLFGTTPQLVAQEDLKTSLDEWLSTHTAGMITETAIALSNALDLVIQDAVLFLAAWVEPFTTSTAWLDFRAPNGRQEIDDALSGVFNLSHVSTEHWEAVRLPYDDTLAMDVILPAEGIAPEELAPEELATAHRSLDTAPPVRVAVTMPAVDLRSEHDLLDQLMRTGTSLRRGLDGIFPGAEVGAMVQQVRLQVDAKGTVGAAATELAMLTSAPLSPERTVEFTVERPYVMNVADTRTGWSLFLAIASDAEAARRESSS